MTESKGPRPLTIDAHKDNFNDPRTREEDASPFLLNKEHSIYIDREKG